jgi:uncharacterized protein
MTSVFRSLPKPSPEALPFWEGCGRNVLLLQYCEVCGAINWFPRHFCFNCDSSALDWRPATGLGTLETYSIVHRPINEAWKSEVPYTLAIVKLDEGIRMFTRLLDPPGKAPTIGARVAVRFVEVATALKAPFWQTTGATDGDREAGE